MENASDGALTPFQAVCTALAATVGTGNIAGVAGAIAIGGPGAVFWMWVSAVLGMCTKFAEVTLAVYYRETNKEGDLVGGPMYYIKNGLGKNWQFLAVLFSAFGVLTVFGTGNATQVNTITTAVNSALLSCGLISEGAVKTSNLIQGIIIAALVALILLGGVKRIGQVTEKLVPFMALLYIVLSVGIILFRIQALPSVIQAIFEGAFKPAAVTGGAVGSLFMSMKKGVSRGIFSNEAGLGTGSIAHACADTRKPVKQGMFGIFEVFMCTMVICTFSAMVILVTGTWTTGAPGSVLAINAFGTIGLIGRLVASISLILFAASSALSMSTSSGILAENLLGKAARKIMQVLVVVFCFLGGTVGVDAALPWVDVGNMIIILVHVIGIMFWVPKMRELTLDYFKRLKNGEVEA